ncbi:MAG TPA: hypothetical protein VGD41_04450 [Pyrinomonadaceae bacterium]
MDFRPLVLCAVLATAISPNASAEPLLTISCEKPEGVSMAYGVSLADRMSAPAGGQSGKVEPSLKGPTKDEYRGKPTFVIDSDKKTIGISWTEFPEDPELLKQAKESGLPHLPPVPAARGSIVEFFDEQISAVQAEPWSIMTFSFFPKLGMAYINQQAISLASKNTHQVASFARCQFSWMRPQ